MSLHHLYPRKEYKQLKKKGCYHTVSFGTLGLSEPPGKLD
jgi:hypothetical protein